MKHPKKTTRRIRREISAGGVAARQENNQWLVALLKTEHKRGEVWVLPKGHVEPGANETVADAARREVQEEAGLTDLSVKGQLGVTRFSFQAEEALVRKTVHYFLMTTQQKTLTPQQEEGLLAATWAPIDEAIELLAYDTDKEIVGRAMERLTGVKMRRPPSRGRSLRRGEGPHIHT
ncbi:MAG TPA: NUDIX domain-containing protein [Candidatus Andersenbacteria bacterium]|nr:NUDIX domain-containing protein [Candidatus Andersenbacteria bacterium]